jgi:integrase
MTADELRRLAVLIERTDHDAIDRAAAYLRACADALDAGPVAWHYDGRDQIEVYPLAMPAQAQPLRLPEPMTDEEVAALIDETEYLPTDHAVRYLVETGERRVEEANE